MADEQSAASPRKPLGRSAESLGWLASSGVQPKKRKEIQGVSAASLVALKAEMYKAQQEAALVREGKLDGEQLRARRRGGSGLAAVTQRGNAGVAERDRRDRLELKTTSQRMSEAAAALERKAQLYDRLARGEAEASGGEYEVDFLLKQQHPIDTAGLAAGSRGGSLVSSDMAQERRRREWEEDVTVGLADEEARERKREGGRQAMEEVVRETEADRRRAAARKQQQEEAASRKRERLKAAFLKKKLQQRKQPQPKPQQEQDGEQLAG